MRFVVDAQLPPALARYLASQGHQSEHVFDLDMIGADDSVIWNYADASGAATITKDEDFAIRISVAIRSVAHADAERKCSVKCAPFQVW